MRLAIVWESLTGWKCRKAMYCICVTVSQGICWRLLVKSMFLMLSLQSPNSVVHTDKSSYLCCVHRHKRLTKAEDVVVLALLLPEPCTRTGGCFHVFNTRCCLWLSNVLFVSCRSLNACMTTTLIRQQDVTYTLPAAFRVKAHVVVLEHGLQLLGLLLNSLTYNYVIQKWWSSEQRQSMCGHHVRPQLCWLCFCFHEKMTWANRSQHYCVCCRAILVWTDVCFCVRRRKTEMQRRKKRGIGRKK